MRTSAAAVVLTLLFSLLASAQTLFQGRIDVGNFRLAMNPGDIEAVESGGLEHLPQCVKRPVPLQGS